MVNDLLKYKNRQIVINEYNDEELVTRNGFFLDEIKINNNSIIFIKNGMQHTQIDLQSNSIVKKDGSFPNFFLIEWDSFRIEIYFP